MINNSFVAFDSFEDIDWAAVSQGIVMQCSAPKMLCYYYSTGVYQ